ncbi:MAG TPA: hypothetical protein VIJ50_02515 [Solirubrobacteraceae bacterium]
MTTAGSSEPPAPSAPPTRSVARPTPLHDLFGRLRRRHVIPILVVFAVFLVLSGMLARFLSTENVERDDVLAALEAETSSNEQALFSRLSGCRAIPRCVSDVKWNSANLPRHGQVKIVSLTSATAYSLTGATGHTRVAWVVLGHLPVVQCATVRRTGSFLTGMSVSLLVLSKPIPNEGNC